MHHILQKTYFISGRGKNLPEKRVSEMFTSIKIVDVSAFYLMAIVFNGALYKYK